MTSNERQMEILQLLESKSEAISASYLSEKFGVSRQTIVGDIALIRAKGQDIFSTARGYLVNKKTDEDIVVFKVACKHKTDKTELEINTIIDNGGKLIDVTVEHEVYGELTGQLNISSRYEAQEFLLKVNDEKTKLLSKLTSGIHLHTISCKDTQSKERIIKSLLEIGVLLA